LIRVPGVFIQDRFNFAQDTRISIRGFGSRAAFGIRGIKILVDGIPLTLPDGQSQVDTLDLGATQRIEVMRGPISALYGNASGGVISIITEDGPKKPFLEERTTVGQFGLIKPQVKMGGQAGPLNYFLNLSYLNYDGYRDQSFTENGLLSGKVRLDLDENSDLTILMTLLDSPSAEDPGGLTQMEVNQNRRQAAPLNRIFQAGEEVTEQRLGMIYRGNFQNVHELEVYGYASLRQFNNSLPFIIVELERVFVGGGIKYGYLGDLFGFNNRLTMGIDIENQDDNRKNFNNLNGQKSSDLLLNQEEDVPSFGPYIQDQFSLFNDFVLFLGARFDYIRFQVDDFLNPDESGSRTFKQLTGRAGILYSPLPEVNMYLNIAQSFETPTTTELVNRPGGQGGLNPDIGAQKAINYEIGVKGQTIRRIEYQLALYYITLRDELIPFAIDGRTFFRNAGKSRRFGLEFGLDFELITGLRTSLAYTYLNSEYVTFGTDGLNFDGNKVPGQPPNVLNLELFYDHSSGFFAGVDLLYVSSFFVNDENTVKNPSYTAANVRLGFEKRYKGLTISPLFGIQNLFNQKYNDNVRINAVAGNFFEPAPTINIYGGIAISYNFGKSR
jgi:iron complex outermembrane receptor protein